MKNLMCPTPRFRDDSCWPLLFHVRLIRHLLCPDHFEGNPRHIILTINNNVHSSRSLAAFPLWMDHFFVPSRLILCPVGSVASSAGRAVLYFGASLWCLFPRPFSDSWSPSHVWQPLLFYCMRQFVFCPFLSPQVPVVRWGRGKTPQDGALPPPSKHALPASRQKPAVQHQTKGRDRLAQRA